MPSSKYYPEVFMQKSLRCKDSRLGFGILILFGITLARKSATEKLEIRHASRVCFSDVVTEPLSPRVKQRAVAALRMLVLFAMACTFKSPGTAQPLPEPADAGEHINKSYGFSHHAPSLKFTLLSILQAVGIPPFSRMHKAHAGNPVHGPW